MAAAAVGGSSCPASAALRPTAADIDAASMHIFAALRATPGPRRSPALDTPSLKSTVEFTTL